jgi:hypothetical protein
MILSAARLDDDRSDGCGSQRGLDLRLVVGLTDLSGTSTLAEGVGGLVGREDPAAAGAWTIGPLKATGCANVDGEAIVATGALPTGALAAPPSRSHAPLAQKNEYRLAAHRSVQPQAGRPAQALGGGCCRTR